MWETENSLLGTHPELQNFYYSIRYYTENTLEASEGESGSTEIVYYPVRITAGQTGYSTVIITSGLTANISGFFKGVFNDSLTTLDKQLKLKTISTLQPPEGSVWDKVDRDNLYQVISFKADTTRSRTLTYLAEALKDDVVIASQIYTILAQDTNWTSGQLVLKELVSYASSK
jgi:hypothetical protein